MKLSPRSRRRGLLVLAGLLALYLLYVGASFLALRGGAPSKLTRDVDDFKLDSTGGYSFWPGHFVLRDARLRFKDHNIELAIEAREVSLRVSILPLFSKTIRVDEITLHDARYKMLHRVTDGHRNRDRLAAFPDIGFERSKVYDEPSPPYQVPPYRIRVESIRANVLEAWILEYRALGNFEVTGGFEVHENVTVLPSHADLSRARLFLGAKELSKDADCDIRARLGPFPGSGAVTEVLAKMSGTVQCRMTLQDLSVFRAYWPSSKFVLEGSGTLRAMLEVENGQLRSSTAQAALDLGRVGIEGAVLKGSATVDARVDPNGTMYASGTVRGHEHQTDPVDIDEVTFAFELGQSRVWQLALQKANVRATGVGVLDPGLARRVGLVGAPPMKLERANLAFEYAAEAHRPGTVSVVSDGAVAFFPAVGSTVACAYRVAARCEVESARLSCPGSELGCVPLRLNRGKSDTAAVAVSARAEKLELARWEVQSGWALELDDPTKVLQLAVAEDTWTKLGLALAPLGPVAGRLRANYRNQTLAGTVDDLRSGPFLANAGFLVADHFVSRWRIETPLGRFGVAQDRGETRVTPFVDDDWDILAFGR